MPKPQKNLKFEEALEKLEGMIEKLEEGKISLDESIALFEEGTGLAQFCEQKLAEAEGRVEMLTKQKGEGRGKKDE